MNRADLIKIEMRLRRAAQRLANGRSRELAIDCIEAANIVRDHCRRRESNPITKERTWTP